VNSIDKSLFICKNKPRKLKKQKQFLWFIEGVEMKEKILQATAHEFNNRGVKFTIEHVAAHLGISKKTIYQYFSSKDVLITEVIEMVLADVELEEQEILNDKDRDFADRIKDLMLLSPKRIVKVNDWIMEDIKRYRPSNWNRIEQFRYERMLVLSEFLESGILLGIVPALNTKVAARLLLGACTELSKYDFLVENNLDSIQAREVLADIFLHGILKREV